MAKSGSIGFSVISVSGRTSTVRIQGLITTDSSSYRGDHNTGTYSVWGAASTSGSFTSGAPYNSSNKVLFTVDVAVSHDTNGNAGTIGASYNYASSWCTAEGYYTPPNIGAENRTLTLYASTGVAKFVIKGTNNTSGSIAYGGTLYSYAEAAYGYNLSHTAGTLSDGSGNGTWTAGGGSTYEDYWYMQANRTITCYATPWTHTVAFNANGGSGAPGSITKTYGALAYIPSGKPTRAGYTFAGWGTASNSTSASYQAGSAYGADQNGGTITLYAIWSLNYYTLDVNGWLDGASNGGLGGYGTFNITANGSTSTGVGDYCQSLPHGATWSITNITAASGKRYKGVRSGSLSGTLTGGHTVVLSFVTLYTISFNANGGSNAPGAVTKEYGSNATIPSTQPTRTGYIFLGWGTSSTATNATYAPNGAYTANASATLYAVWAADAVLVTFNGNGGIGVPPATTKLNDVTLTLPTTVPTRTRHTFLGWSSDKAATSAYYQPGDSYEVNGNSTLYAIWQRNNNDIYIYVQSGVIEAVSYKEVDTLTKRFDNNGIVYATSFIEHDESNVKITPDGKMYAKEFVEI